MTTVKPPHMGRGGVAVKRLPATTGSSQLTALAHIGFFFSHNCTSTHMSAPTAGHMMLSVLKIPLAIPQASQSFNGTVGYEAHATVKANTCGRAQLHAE